MKLAINIEIVETTENMLAEFLEWYDHIEMEGIEELTDEVRDAFYDWFDSNFDRFVECNLVEVNK